MSLGALNVASLMMCCVNWRFSRASAISTSSSRLLLQDLLCVVFLSLLVIFVGVLWCLLVVIGGSTDSGVGVKAISGLSSSRCNSRLSTQQFGVLVVNRSYPQLPPTTTNTSI